MLPAVAGWAFPPAQYWNSSDKLILVRVCDCRYMFKRMVCVYGCVRARTAAMICATVHEKETEKLWELQEAHLNSLMLPDWENMERLLGTDVHRLFLDFPFPQRKSGEKVGTWSMI